VDEYDVEEPPVTHLADGEVSVTARMAVDELNELLHAELPEGDWDTVGGLLFNVLGRVPVEGESAEVDGVRLVAEKVEGNRIGRIRVAPLHLPDPAGAEDTAGEPDAEDGVGPGAKPALGAKPDSGAGADSARVGRAAGADRDGSHDRD